MKGLKVGTAAWWEASTQFDAASGCVLYTNPRPDGYRQVRWNGRQVLVHRLAYEQVHGPIDPSLKLCHRCDRPNCVNPAHLFTGTQKDNLRDMFRKGRARPRGKTTAALTAFPAVSYRLIRREAQAMSNSETLKSGNIWDRIRLLRTRAISPGATMTYGADVPVWCRVTNVPPTRPTQAIVKWEPAKSASPELRRNESAVAPVAQYCSPQRRGQ